MANPSDSLAAHRQFTKRVLNRLLLPVVQGLMAEPDLVEGQDDLLRA
jgi:hypothetical protein